MFKFPTYSWLNHATIAGVPDTRRYQGATKYGSHSHFERKLKRDYGRAHNKHQLMVAPSSSSSTKNSRLICVRIWINFGLTSSEGFRLI